MTKKLSAPVVSIICSGIWLIALDSGEAKGREKDWITLDNCRLIPNKANDGDSFHVRANDTEYLVRLYFVDAPETASVGPERLIDQAKYFGLSVPQVIEIGLEAKKFVDTKLSEPFTVVTRLAGGLGWSKVQRIYGFVRTKEGDLGEQLIANGLARIHGISAPLPGGSTSADEREKLAQLESEAKRRKAGGWGMLGQSSSQSPLNDSHSISVTPTSSSLGAAVSPGEVRNRAKEKTQRGKIDINTATEKELTTVPGIGHVMAARIIAARPFRSADDLKRVSGIGEKKYAQIRPYFQWPVWIKITSRDVKRAREDSLIRSKRNGRGVLTRPVPIRPIQLIAKLGLATIQISWGPSLLIDWSPKSIPRIFMEAEIAKIGDTTTWVASYRVQGDTLIGPNGTRYYRRSGQRATKHTRNITRSWRNVDRDDPPQSDGRTAIVTAKSPLGINDRATFQR